MLEISKISAIFLVCILIGFTTGLVEPSYLVWFKPYLTFLLGIIMFSMGLNLENSDFNQVIHLKVKILLIIIIKYLAMPILSFTLGKLFNLSQDQLIGLVLVSACPGGMASSVMSYLSKANIALTIIMTFVTTLVAPIITPLIMYLFFHKYIHIEALKMFTTVFTVVIFPVSLGLFVKKLFNNSINSIKPYTPFISMLAIGLLIGCITGLNRELIFQMPLSLSCVVLISNLCGILVGYIVSWRLFFGKNNYNNYAVAFEFGIQDSGLAVVLAYKFFSGAAMLAGVIYSICENITGAILIRLLPKIVHQIQE